MPPKTNEEWVEEYNKAIDQGFSIPTSWLRTLLTEKDKEREEALKLQREKILKDGYINYEIS